MISAQVIISYPKQFQFVFILLGYINASEVSSVIINDEQTSIILHYTDSLTVEMYEEIWTDISPTRESGIRRHLPTIRDAVEHALNSSSWSRKVQVSVTTIITCGATWRLEHSLCYSWSRKTRYSRNGHRNCKRRSGWFSMAAYILYKLLVV